MPLHTQIIGWIATAVVVVVVFSMLLALLTPAWR
jgi:hypothetical protein